MQKQRKRRNKPCKAPLRAYLFAKRYLNQTALVGKIRFPVLPVALFAGLEQNCHKTFAVSAFK